MSFLDLLGLVDPTKVTKADQSGVNDQIAQGQGNQDAFRGAIAQAGQRAAPTVAGVSTVDRSGVQDVHAQHIQSPSFIQAVARPQVDTSVSAPQVRGTVDTSGVVGHQVAGNIPQTAGLVQQTTGAQVANGDTFQSRIAQQQATGAAQQAAMGQGPSAAQSMFGQSTAAAIRANMAQAASSRGIQNQGAMLRNLQSGAADQIQAGGTAAAAQAATDQNTGRAQYLDAVNQGRAQDQSQAQAQAQLTQQAGQFNATAFNDALGRDQTLTTGAMTADADRALTGATSAANLQATLATSDAQRAEDAAKATLGANVSLAQGDQTTDLARQTSNMSADVQVKLAQADNNLKAQLANQGVDLDVLKTNAAAGNQAALANLTAALQQTGLNDDLVKAYLSSLTTIQGQNMTGALGGLNADQTRLDQSAGFRSALIGGVLGAGGAVGAGAVGGVAKAGAAGA